MQFRYLVAIVTMSFSSVGFAADSGEVLFKKNKCEACHKLETKSVGPNLKAIAAKYASNKEAQAMLEKKVRTGGSGVWGSMPMPRVAASVSDEEIKTMIAWVLTH